MAYTINDGKSLINLVRTAICSVLDGKEKIELDTRTLEKFREKRGVFVTLHNNKKLRGCIGFIEPIYKLYEAVIKAGKLAAFDDPRFPSLTKEEYDNIEIELSILTPFEEIKVDKPEDYLKEIKVCRDGLIIDNGFLSGCLLPQVPGENNWDEKEFLEHTCLKAGLDKDSWMEDDCRVLKFSAQIFAEENDKIVEKYLDH